MKYKNDQISTIETDNEEGNKHNQTYYPLHPRNHDFHGILHDQEVLLLLTRGKDIKPEDIQVKYSRSANLRQVLIKANLEPPYLPKGCQPCWKPRCKTCQHVSPCTYTDN